MATLVWDQPGDRLYETGVSKGVLYNFDGSGVAWNGLISVQEDNNDEVEPVSFDGIKFNDIVTIGDFSGTIRAFTYPEDFLFYEGTLKDQTGFYLYNQQKSRFGLSYQTNVGDDLNGAESSYKIHILYNLTAIPSQIDHKTISGDLEPLEFEWNITSVPEEIDFFRPTSHVVIDSRTLDENLLNDIMDILYGDDVNDAQLPTLKSLATFIRNWDRLIITDLGNGLWKAESKVEGVINMINDTTFEIITDSAIYLDDHTYEISSSEKNEEDIWLP